METLSPYKKLIFKSVFAVLRAEGLSIRKTEWGEYRVAFLGRGNEASAYYTSDLEDAFDTGMHMAKRAQSQKAQSNA